MSKISPRNVAVLATLVTILVPGVARAQLLLPGLTEDPRWNAEVVGGPILEARTITADTYLDIHAMLPTGEIVDVCQRPDLRPWEARPKREVRNIPASLAWWIDRPHTLTKESLADLIEEMRRERIPGVSLAGWTGAGCIVVVRNGNIDHDSIRRLATLSDLVWLDLSHTEIDDSDLAALSELPRLRVLDIGFCSVTDAGCAHLARIRSLRRLNLAGTAVTGDGLAHLAALPDLRSVRVDYRDTDPAASALAKFPALIDLDMSVADLTDAGLAALASVKTLRRLELIHASSLTGSGFLAFREHSRLEEVNLSWCRTLGDDGVAAVARLPGLKSIGLQGTTVSAVAIAALAPCVQLRRLNLGDGRVTDEAMDMVAKFTDLEELALSHSAITDAGLAKLSGLAHLKILNVFGCSLLTGAVLDTVGRLKNLQVLNLDHATVPGASFARIRGLQSLRRVSLRKAKTDDAALEHLAALPALEELDFYGASGLTPRAPKRFRAARPDCRILGDE